MHQLVEMYHSKHLHHAYFVVTHKTEEFINKLKHFFENIVGIKTDGNPDFYHGKFQTLTIGDARAITESASRKSLDSSSTKKIYIIEADFITEEAQNSLLKAFEEPTSGTHFFIISPQDVLLPTLRSRMLVIQAENDNLEKLQKVLDLSPAERLTLVKVITEGISDEEKTKQDAIVLLNQIEAELYEKGVEKNVKSLEVCELARKSLYDRGAPVKIILENLMLTV